jgi:hypothetical protein
MRLDGRRIWSGRIRRFSLRPSGFEYLGLRVFGLQAGYWGAYIQQGIDAGKALLYECNYKLIPSRTTQQPNPQ